jgi:hypothetical protein
MPEQPDRTKILVCSCDDTVSRTLAVLTLTPEVAAVILGCVGEYAEAAVKAGRRLDWMEFGAFGVRFFHEMFYDGAGVPALFAVYDSVVEEGDDPEWTEFPGLVLPDEGDYRLGWSHLRIGGDAYICYQAEGKHASESFETAFLAVELLKEVAGPLATKHDPANIQIAMMDGCA